MDLLNTLDIDLILKVAFLLVIIMYSVFAFVIFNQIRAMNSIVYVPHSSQILSVISVVHLVFAISLFLSSVVIL